VVARSNAASARATNGPVAQAGCPVLTLSPAEGTDVFNVSLDFGQGCPLPDQESPVCSGSTSGQIDLPANRLILTFVAFSCTDAPTVNGNVDLIYSQVDSLINFNGNWDLSFTTVDGDQRRITGPGDVTFDPSTQTATINQFEGQLTLNSEVWNVTMQSVQVSLADNPSLLPSAGTIQLDGGFLRQFTIQFNEDSPSTGVVEVSILGLFFFPVDIDELGLGV
jgi:hypothetical protein